MTEPRFPLLDYDREAASDDHQRVVIHDCGAIELFVDEMDGWVTLPLRIAHNQAAGYVLEFGPYTFSDSDLPALVKAVQQYYEVVTQ
ncbi:hypothetical protein [Prescottella equi]|uniref:hypothetical protein n=1 Tax=Rhodococcus hoagii TaxID=43767 RepID=UPI000A0F5DCB|nr:hypothetical protein [Prescottella equi]ORL35004.1 hypothetical protein A6I91_02010 [Prescottella equi]